MSKTLVILGTSREDSNTLQAVKNLSPHPVHDFVDLRELRIEHYDYREERLAGDDFLSVVERMLAADTLVFATPVYWYTMSGVMKVFFDRFTQLTRTNKAMGKALAGKRVYVVACGSAPEPPPGFEYPFRATSEYFDMEFVEAFYQRGRGSKP